MNMHYAATRYVHDMHRPPIMPMGSPPPYHPYYTQPPQDNASSQNSEQWKHNRVGGNVSGGSGSGGGTNKRPNAAGATAEIKTEKKDLAKAASGGKHNVKEETIASKDMQLIPSPPPKKRKIIGSWDEHDPQDHISAASPGIFRSPPMHSDKMKVKGLGFVSYSLPKRNMLHVNVMI